MNLLQHCLINNHDLSLSDFRCKVVLLYLLQTQFNSFVLADNCFVLVLFAFVCTCSTNKHCTWAPCFTSFQEKNYIYDAVTFRGMTCGVGLAAVSIAGILQLCFFFLFKKRWLKRYNVPAGSHLLLNTL